jgi:hypothetical protein
MKYRKKPVVVEAMQLTEETADEVIQFCGGRIKSHPLTGIVIETLEGDMLVNVDDWVIKGVKGEFYPCKSDIFEATYERVEGKDDGGMNTYRISVNYEVGVNVEIKAHTREEAEQKVYDLVEYSGIESLGGETVYREIDVLAELTEKIGPTMEDADGNTEIQQ